MALSLEIVGEMAEGMGPRMSHVFGTIGGTIGRSEKNDWVLPDKFVSARHVLVTFKGGEFYIRDASTNGTFVNDPKMRKRRRGTIRLKDGDTLYIGRYQVRVNVYPDLPTSCPTFSTEAPDTDFSDTVIISDEAQEALDDLLKSGINEKPETQAAGPIAVNGNADNHDKIRDLLVNQGIEESIITQELTQAVDTLVKKTVGNVMTDTFGASVDRILQQQADNS